ncbi:MAG TPA: endopeptidase La [Candidatus Onthocola stercoravium]|nr:endopeptidase La [Candidatus Onthocola stercoravium]
MFNIPVIILKKLVILPKQEIKLELNNIISEKTIKEASLNYKGEILVIAPIDTKEEEPSVDDLPKVGVIARVKSKIASENGIQVKIQGIKRVAVNKYFNNFEDILFSEVMYIDLPPLVEDEKNAILRMLIDTLNQYIETSNSASNDILAYITNNKDLDRVTDVITSYLPFDISKKLEYMQNINPIKRAKALIKDMQEEIKIAELDAELDGKVDDILVRDQRKFVLKEKIKVIKKELGEETLQEEQAKHFREILSKLRIEKRIKDKIEHEINKFELMNESSPEISILRNYIDYMLNLPWTKSSKETSNFNTVLKSLNESHYGLDNIKTRITEYVAIKNINKNISSPIICLVGPPGVGKTSIAMSIAKSLNRKFYKISVGGLNDSTELIGSRRTYLAASPGKIIQAINKCGSNNPVILIDEVDKMVKDYKGDPASTLLEILDPVQNKFFTDNYLEEPFDLSNVLFILTANYIADIPSPLIDRVEIIELNSYTIFEKKDIAKKYLLPRIFKEHVIIDENIRISDELLYFIINSYTKEAGVRDLERVLSSLIRKMAINNIKTINEEKVIKLLGNPKYTTEIIEENIPGVVNMLAYTNMGGVVTTTEVIDYKGNGNILITGSVGKVMEESIQVIVSFVKSHYKYNLNNIDLHFHLLDASTKKDGPSAGLSIAMALISLLEKRTIPSDVAFTGELTLNGKILKIGGLKEKLIGAYNKNINTVYIPTRNVSDLKDIPKEIVNKLEIIPVENFDELYKIFFK